MNRLTKEEVYRRVASKELTVEEALIYLKDGSLKKEEAFSSAYPIERPEEFSYPLSEGQKALWMIYHQSPNNYVYNVPCAFVIDQDIDVAALVRALERLVDRHSVLRTTIEMEKGEPIQREQLKYEVSFEHVYTSLSDLELKQKIREDARIPFNLEKGPLFKTILYTRSTKDHYLLMNFHHIIIDGVSLSILMKDLQAVYLSEKNGADCFLPEIKKSFKEFVKWQDEMLKSAEGQSHRDFWIKRLTDDCEPLDLYIDHSRPIAPTYKGDSCAVDIDEVLTSQLNSLSISHRVTLFSTMLAAFNVLLHRYCHQDTICVGTPTAGRMGTPFEDLVGYFVNMVVIKNKVLDDLPFTDFLKQVHAHNLDVFEHSDYPFFTLAKEVSKQSKSLNISKLLQVTFHFQSWVNELVKGPTAVDLIQKDYIFSNPIQDIHQEGEFDLALEIFIKKDMCSFILKYNPDIFAKGTIERMLGHYVQILKDIVEHPNKKISEIELITPEEKQQLLVEWNQTDSEYPKDRCVHELFAEQALRTPHAIAAVCEEDQLTYQGLYEKSTVLKEYLCSQGIGVGDMVGIFMEPSLDMVAGILGVLQSGAAYVPLDPKSPADRLSYMLEDTQAPLLLTQSHLQGRLEGFSVRMICLDQEWEQVEQVWRKPSTLSRKGAQPEDLAYIIYTSGSTGKPKGVQVLHQGLMNVIWSMAKQPGCTDKDRILALTTICFDIAAVEIFMPLVKGGIVDILPAEITRDGRKLLQKLEEGEATIVQATPATWQMLMAAEWTKKLPIKVITAGEALSRELADKLLARADEVWNQYGPTENSIYTSISQVKERENITIGRPIHNVQVYILDRSMNPVPIGVPGELYISGDGLAKGYLNKPEQNESSFVENPFSGEKDSRLYRTGDLVRYLPNGDIEYLGRMDHQVKIRGFRIELGEIESALKKMDDVEDAVVLVKEDSSRLKQKKLVAFLIAKPTGVKWESRARKERLQQTLPDYMIPSTFVFLDEYPMTLSRKVDRKELAKIEIQPLEKNQSNETVRETKGLQDQGMLPALSSEQKSSPKMNVDEMLLYRVEEDLQEIVANVLEVNTDQIDKQVHLGEYGFDSITFTSLSMQVTQKLQIELSPNIMFEYTTIERIGAYILNTFYGQVRQTYQEFVNVNIHNQTNVQMKQVAIDPPKGKDTRIQEPIAIIGIAGRMPKSSSLQEFWQNLITEEDLVTEVPNGRWDFKVASSLGPSMGGYIEDVDKFDAPFFNIIAREAELMDPQHRIFLENVWHTIEDSGYKPSDLAGTKTGVFVGVTRTDYSDVLMEKGQNSEMYSISGVSRSMLANRVSNILDINGPSESVDTACSSSLIAIHRAVQALQNGTCDMAIAGGVNLLLSPFPSMAMSKAGILSEDGMCKPFDHEANGYVRGEGVGSLLLKPLRQAEEDGDHIYAIIKGIAVNHGGRSNQILNPSSPKAQTDLLKDVYLESNVDPNTISYIESHGIGTVTGDMTEVNSLKQGFEEINQIIGKRTIESNYCGIGSVKSNIGHLEGAAGIASVLKVILSMKHKKIPASLHINEMNPYLQLEDSPFYIVKEPRYWKNLRNENNHLIPRRAGISSFGSSGVNAHLIIEEYEMDRDLELSSNLKNSNQRAFLLSAKTEERLVVYAERMLEYLKYYQDQINFDSIIFTSQVGREAMQERLVIFTTGMKDLQERLTYFCKLKKDKHILRGSSKSKTTDLSKHKNDQNLKSITEEKMAREWVKGKDIQWEILYSNRKSFRTALPCYPFLKERYWATDNKNELVTHDDFTVLGAGDIMPSDEFTTFWDKLRTGEITTIGRVEVHRQYYHQLIENQKKMIHLMVTSPTFGNKLEVIVSGQGSPVLLIPGFGITAPQWLYQFKDWSSKYQLIVIHMPGVGLSEGHQDTSFTAIGQMYMEVIEELGIKDPIHVIGSSWGGMQAQHIARDYSEKVASLVLVGTPCHHKFDSDQAVAEKLANDFSHINDLDGMKLCELSTCLDTVATAKYMDIFSEDKISTLDILPEITAPTLIVAGKHDQVIERQEFQWLEEKIPNAIFVEIESAGHVPNVNCPEEFNQIVGDFIDKQKGKEQGNIVKKK